MDDQLHSSPARRRSQRAKLAGQPVSGDTPPPSRKRGRPFPKGVSGNPKGRPKANRNRTTLDALALLDSQAESLVRKVLRSAHQGDLTSLRFCLERLIPLKKDAPIDFSLPALHDVSDIRKLFSAVASAFGNGGITPSEARVLVSMAGAFEKLLDATEIETRISELEKESAGANPK